LNALVFPGAPDPSASNGFRTSGLRYGIYAGWMFTAYNQWVLGFEGDYAWHNQSQSVPGVLGCTTAACTGGVLTPFDLNNDRTTIRNGNDWSFRGRVGFLVIPDVLLYGTGGVAAQRVEATVVCGGLSPACSFPLASTSSATLWGFTVGAGLEWRAWNNVLIRGEYRFNDYGTFKQRAFLNSGIIEEFADVRVKAHMATFGIAYLFPPPR
jgi:outer membrane immunogenic protein